VFQLRNLTVTATTTAAGIPGLQEISAQTVQLGFANADIGQEDIKLDQF